jgi:hypothetical protein
VWPKLKAIRDEHSDSWDDLYAAVLKLHIVDPAMGSGHMLQAAFARIIEFLRRQNESMSEKGLPVPTWDSEFEYRVRTRVARGCIYGVDLNPMAVELAKLVMWIRLFRKDKAFEFFDYNLTCGNSLIGAYDEQLKIAPGRAGVQFSLMMTADEVEENAQKELLARVQHMMEMPRDTRDMVHAVDDYWHEQVIPQQRQLTFLYNIRLSRWLLPNRWDKVAEAIDSLTIGIQQEGLGYVGKVLDPELLTHGGPELLRQVHDRHVHIVRERDALHSPSACVSANVQQRLRFISKHNLQSLFKRVVRIEVVKTEPALLHLWRQRGQTFVNSWP